MTFLTVPCRTIPSFKSSSSSTSSRRMGAGTSSLGSLPGFAKASIISFKVYSPTESFCSTPFNPPGREERIFPISLPFPERSSFSAIPANASISFATLQDSGCTEVISKSSFPPRILRNPALCSKAFGPNLATFKSSFRDLKAPFSSRKATIFLAIVLLIPEMQERREAEAVFKSTPTLFTQSSTTLFNCSVSLLWFISC